MPRNPLSRATVAPGELDERLSDLRVALQGIEDELYGNPAKRQVGEKRRPTIESRLDSVELGAYRSTYGPTDTMRRSLEIVNAQFQKIKSDLKKARADAATLGEDLLQAGAPWVEGNPL